jgi:hypothetical protein
MAMLYLIVLLAVLCGISSLAVDWARVQVATGELQSAADAAARAGAAALVRWGEAEAVSAAIAYGGYQKADGTPVQLTAADVTLGNYTNGRFDAGGFPTNAVRVRAERTSARGNAVPLSFARLLGRSTCDASGESVAVGAERPPGFVGMTGVVLKNNALAGSYNSVLDPDPTRGTASGRGVMATNTSIVVKNNDALYGDVVLGPAATLDGGLMVTGQVYRLSKPIPQPEMPEWASAGENPLGLGRDLVVSSTTVLPGGKYWFTSLVVSADLSFSGPATVYVNGNVVIDARVTAYQRRPANLMIFQLGSGRTFGDSAGNSVEVTARIVAPGADLVVKNDAVIRGSMVFNTITFKNNADLFYDESLGDAVYGVNVVQVK